MNTQSPPTTLSEERLRHIEPLVHETFNFELGDTGDYEGHSVIRTENGGTWYSDTINPDDDHIEDHAEIVRRVNAFPSLLHAAEQNSRREADVRKLRETIAFMLASAHPHPVEHVGMYSAWRRGEKVLAETLPPAPENQEGGAA